MSKATILNLHFLVRQAIPPPLSLLFASLNQPYLAYNCDALGKYAFLVMKDQGWWSELVVLR